jgi:formate/nitrite transporter
MQRFDALMPPEMARKAERVGVQKTRLHWLNLLALAVLAGAFIALGAMFATTVLAGANGTLPFGVSRLLAGGAFCLGLVLVVAGGAELFTGNNLIVMAWAAGDVRLQEMLRVWLIVYFGNLVGAVATAALVFLSGQYLSGDGAVAKVVLDRHRKGEPGLRSSAVLGILCNVLVCLAVWLAYAARSLTDKVLAVLFPVSAFVAAGFEHCVANMYFVPLGLFVKAWAPVALWTQLGGGAAGYEALTWLGFVQNLIPVTIGNIIGVEDWSAPCIGSSICGPSAPAASRHSERRFIGDPGDRIAMRPA